MRSPFPTPVHRELQRIRINLRLHRLVLTSLWSACFLASGTFGLLLCDQLPFPLWIKQVAFLAGALLGCGAWLWIAWVKVWRPALKIRNLSLMLEKKFPQFDGRLISFIELWNRVDIDIYFTKGLESKTLSSLHRLPLNQFFPKKLIKRLGFVVLVQAILLGTFIQKQPDGLFSAIHRMLQRPPQWAMVQARAVLEVFYLGLSNIDIQYLYPPYTALPPKDVSNSDGHLQGVKGTRIFWRARSHHPLSEATMQFSNQQVIPFVLSSNGQDLKADFVLLESGSFVVEAKTKRGRTVKSKQEFLVQVNDDAKPTITIENPREDIEVSEIDTFQFNYKASDDFGLERVEVHVKKSGGPVTAKSNDAAVVVKRFKGQVRDDLGQYALDLRSQKLAPGETIEVFFRAFDSDAISQDKFSDSEIRKVTMMSNQKLLEDLIRQQEEVFSRVINLLADHLETVLVDKAPSKIVPGTLPFIVGDSSLKVEKDKEFLGKYQGIKKDFEFLKQKIKGSKESKKDATGKKVESFNALIHKIGTLEDRLSGLTQKPDSLDASLQKYREFFSFAGSQMETVVLIFERMILEQRFEALIEDGSRLEKDIQDFKNVMDNLNQENAEAALKALEKMQSSMREYQNKMLEAQAAQPSEEFVNPEAIAELQKDSMDAQIEKIKELLKKGEFEKAKEEMKKLEEKMQGLTKGMRDESQKAQSKMQTEAKQILDKAEKLVKDQEKLIADGEKAKNDQKVEAKQKQQQTYQPVLNENLKRLAEVQKMMNQFRSQRKVRKTYVEYVVPFEDRLFSVFKDLKNQLTDAEIALALGSAQEARLLLERLRLNLRNISRFSGENANRNERLMEYLDRSQDLLTKMIEDLEKFKTQNSAQQSDSKQGEQLGQGQKGLRERAQQIQNEIEALGKKMPSLNKDFFDQKSAEEKFPGMKEAQEKFEAGEISEALPPAQDALNQLKKGVDEMKQSLSEGKDAEESKGQGNPEFIPQARPATSSEENVPIPSAEEYVVPEEFRKEVLDAMKRPSPKNFEKENKDYYERLVK